MVFSSDARFIHAIMTTRPVDCSWMMAGISPTPSQSSRMPQVRRWVPEIESIPTVPISSPKTAIMRAFKMDPAAR